MLDILFAIASQRRRPSIDPAYRPDQAITVATFMPHPTSHDLTVVFAPWHIPRWYLGRLAQKVGKSSNALVYEFNPQLLSDDIAEVRSSFEFIAMAIGHDVKHLRVKHGFHKINLIGISLGNVALGMTAEELESFDAVTMVVPGSSLADSLWTGWRTRRLRQQITQQHIRLAELEREWDILAPGSHVDVLRSHPVTVVLARNDRFIPYDVGAKLVHDLALINPAVVVVRKPLGHIATILNYEHGLPR